MSESSADTERDRDRDTRNERDRDARNRTDLGAMKWVSAIAALIGLWIAASPFVYETTETALWNNVVVGIAVFLIAGYNYSRMSNGRPASTGSAGLVVLLGLWTLLAPFAFEFGSDALIWSNVASGVVVAVLAAYNAYASRRIGTPATTTTRA